MRVFAVKELSLICHELERHPTHATVLATLVTVEGSSYRRPGARMLITADGRRLGSISGGCLEEDVVARAAITSRTGLAELITYDTTSENDLVWGVGTGCHGVVRVLLEKLSTAPAWADVLNKNLRLRQPTSLGVVWKSPEVCRLGTQLVAAFAARSAESVFYETVQPPIPLVIFGAGDDAVPLVRLAKEIGWHITLADARPALLTRERFPEADRLVAIRCEANLASQGLAMDPQTLAVVMTHHYVHDRPLLQQLLPLPLAYLGLLGPRQRAEKILADLAATGAAITAEQRGRLHAPIGLDLGANNPAEIALSIVAEIQAELAGRNAQPLRERRAPIHG